MDRSGESGGSDVPPFGGVGLRESGRRRGRLPRLQRGGSGHFVAVRKYAAWAVIERLGSKLDPSIRVIMVSSGVIEWELADSITYRGRFIPADAIAGAISYASG